MFRGEESIKITTTQPEAVVREKVEEALSEIGRVRIDKRGSLEITPKDKFSSLLTETTMEGQINKKKDGEYEIVINYNCKPSIINWVIIVGGTLMLCIGWVAIFVPMTEKAKVSKAVRNALLNVEEAVQ